MALHAQRSALLKDTRVNSKTAFKAVQPRKLVLASASQKTGVPGAEVCVVCLHACEQSAGEGQNGIRKFLRMHVPDCGRVCKGVCDAGCGVCAGGGVHLFPGVPG